MTAWRLISFLPVGGGLILERAAWFCCRPVILVGVRDGICFDRIRVDELGTAGCGARAPLGAGGGLCFLAT